LLEQGPASLSDAELLAIFCVPGCPAKARWTWRDTLLNQFGSLRLLLEADQDVQQAIGAGAGKVCPAAGGAGNEPPPSG
jgi:DNA repair protein RadC